MLDQTIAATSPQPVIFGATGWDEIMQNIRFILSTMVWSVPLDRGFGGSGSYLDAPSPYVAQARMAEIVDVVEKFEPRVRVTGITFADPGTDQTMDGVLCPVLTVRVREGVTL